MSVSNIYGSFSIGLSTNTSTGAGGDYIPMYPSLSTFGLSHSFEVLFPERNFDSFSNYQGYSQVSDSPISIIKLTEPAIARIKLTDSIFYGGELVVHIPYIVDNPEYGIIKPEGPTAYISSRPLILGSSSQFNNNNNNTNANIYVPLPVPKVSLRDAQSLVVYDVDNNTGFGTQSLLKFSPIITNIDLTEDHFSDGKRIFIEMVYYKRRTRSKGVGKPIRKKGGSYIIPSKHIADYGQDDSLPFVGPAGSGTASSAPRPPRPRCRGGGRACLASLGRSAPRTGAGR
jgi:hypothetical protein